MNCCAVVSSVRLRGPIYPTVSLRLAWLSRPSPIHEPIVYLGACPSSFAREGIVPHVQIDPAGSIWISLRYIEKGTTLHGGIGYFVTPDLRLIWTLHNH